MIIICGARRAHWPSGQHIITRRPLVHLNFDVKFHLWRQQLIWAKENCDNGKRKWLGVDIKEVNSKTKTGQTIPTILLAL